jgi:hypothetical protein
MDEKIWWKKETSDSSCDRPATVIVDGTAASGIAGETKKRGNQKEGGRGAKVSEGAGCRERVSAGEEEDGWESSERCWVVT